jgi:cytoskeletal protein RodZ
MDNTTNKKYQDKGWESMKVILDREMPEKKRRILPIFWLFPSVAASIFMVFWIFNPTSQENKTLLTYTADSVMDVEDVEIMNEAESSNPAIASSYTKPELHESSSKSSKKIIDKKPPTKLDVVLTNKRSNNSYNVSPISTPKNLIDNQIGGKKDQSNSYTDVISVNNNLKNENQEAIVNASINDPRNTESSIFLNSKSSESENSEISNFIEHAVVQENALNNNIVDPITTHNSKAETTPKSIETLQPQTKLNFAVEAGLARDLNNNFTSYNLGGRYVLKSTKKIDLLVIAGGYISPNDIQYSYTYVADQSAGFVNNVNVNRTVNYMIGVKSLAQINYNLSSKDGLYLFGGMGALSNWTIDNKEKIPSNNLQTSRDKLEDTASDTKLNYSRINLLFQGGIGYKVDHFGIELFYRPTQNTLRNSGLVGLNQKWTHQVGINGLYFF